MILLGVNVDHVATIREARGTTYPDPIEGAKAAIRGGADQITIHLREDRRHIKDADLERMRREIDKPLNLEMAAAPEIVEIACRVCPNTATFVPERREELTTEGGLDVAGNFDALKPVIGRLRDAGIAVSLFIDPDEAQIDASRALEVKSVELHTGAYCDAPDKTRADKELSHLKEAANVAQRLGLRVCAGHGLNYDNIATVVRALPQVIEYNIGHSIIARSVFVGMEQAVREMKKLLLF